MLSPDSTFFKKVAGANPVLLLYLISHQPSSDFCRTSTISPLGKESSSSSSVRYASTVTYLSMSGGRWGVEGRRGRRERWKVGGGERWKLGGGEKWKVGGGEVEGGEEPRENEREDEEWKEGRKGGREEEGGEEEGGGRTVHLWSG